MSNQITYQTVNTEDEYYDLKDQYDDVGFTDDTLTNAEKKIDTMDVDKLRTILKEENFFDAGDLPEQEMREAAKEYLYEDDSYVLPVLLRLGKVTVYKEVLP